MLRAIGFAPTVSEVIAAPFVLPCASSIALMVAGERHPLCGALPAPFALEVPDCNAALDASNADAFAELLVLFDDVSDWMRSIAEAAAPIANIMDFFPRADAQA